MQYYPFNENLDIRTLFQLAENVNAGIIRQKCLMILGYQGEGDEKT